MVELLEEIRRVIREEMRAVERAQAIATKPLLNVTEAAIFLGCSESAIRKLIRERRVDAVQVAGARVVVTRESILAAAAVPRPPAVVTKIAAPGTPIITPRRSRRQKPNA